MVIRLKKINCLFPVTVSKKNRVGRSAKKKFIIFLVKNVCFMHVLRLMVVWRAEKILG